MKIYYYLMFVLYFSPKCKQIIVFVAADIWVQPGSLAQCDASNMADIQIYFGGLVWSSNQFVPFFPELCQMTWVEFLG